MKRNVPSRRILAGCVLGVWVLSGASSLCRAVPGVLVMKADGRRIEGDLKWKSSQKAYTVILANKVETEVSLDQVGSVDIPAAPAGLEDAIRQVQSGTGFAAAIPVLKRISEDYEMLVYDVTAMRWLADAYTRNGQPKEAVAVCDRLRRNNEGALGDAGFAKAYVDALQASDQIPRLKEILGVIIDLGSREAAAVAMLKRGDVEMKRSNYKDALLDGYLRVVVLFDDVREQQPEALYYASKCFDQLGQTPYAERMRKKLLQSFPQSPYAEKVKSGK